MTDKEELSRGDALARVAVLEAELAELRKRVSVPEGWTISESGDDLLVRHESIGSVIVEPNPSHPSMCATVILRALAESMLAAAPAPVERCPNCLGRGEYAGVYGRHQCDCAAPAPVERVEQPLPCQACGGDGAGGEHEDDCAMAQPAEQQAAPDAPTPTFQLGDHVRKTKGSQWKGRIVGTYSTTLTPEGYAVESDTEKGSVQIYPAAALELSGEGAEPDVAGLVAALEWCEKWFSRHSPTAALISGEHATHPMLSSIRAALAAHQSGGAK